MTPEETGPAIRRDRRKGGSTDPKANIHRSELHDHLESLSKAELIDLALTFFFDDYDRFPGKEPSMSEMCKLLTHEIDGVLISRYLNRHPEEV